MISLFGAKRNLQAVKNPVFNLNTEDVYITSRYEPEEDDCIMLRRDELNNSLSSSFSSAGSPLSNENNDGLPVVRKELPPLRNAPPVALAKLPKTHKEEKKKKKSKRKKAKEVPVPEVQRKASTQDLLLSHKNEPSTNNDAENEAKSENKEQNKTVLSTSSSLLLNRQKSKSPSIQPLNKERKTGTDNSSKLPSPLPDKTKETPKVPKPSPRNNNSSKGSSDRKGSTHRKTSHKTERTSKAPKEVKRPGFYETEEDFCEAICEARLAGDFKDVQAFLEKIYSSTSILGEVFRLEKKESAKGLNLDMHYLDYFHESIIRVPEEVKKASLRAIINYMMTENKKEKNSDDIRALIVLLLNPLFGEPTTYVILAHILRQIGVSQTQEHHFFISLIKQIPAKEFRTIVERVSAFISYRLFPSHNEVQETQMSAWWVPNAAKTLALFNAANLQGEKTIVPHSCFYIRGLEVLDLIHEYQTWQAGSQEFSYCQYPFLMSLSSKRYIMQKDSETKMLMEARQSLVKKVRQKQQPNMNMLFLTLNIRRKSILEDSLAEISMKHKDLKKKLRVMFEGEPGIDLGGVSKEWFFLIMQRLFNEDYGMFKYNEKTKQWWINASCKECYQEYNLVGVIMGLAMYNGINLNLAFPACLYKKLLHPAIVPYDSPHAPVGVCKMAMQDFKQVYPDLANGLQELMSYEGNVEDDLCQTFQVSYTEFGEVKTRNLKPKGETIPVTNENRMEYVDMYIDYMMNKCIYQQFYSFYHGFHSVCASNALLLLRPDEVETLVIGDLEFNISGLEKVTKYDGFKKNDPVIRHLWDVLYSLNSKQHRKFLFFCTGSDRLPVGGVKEIKFKVTRVAGTNATKMLPMAHTCFNQLCLPAYKSRSALQKKLVIAIENAQGFGLE